MSQVVFILGAGASRDCGAPLMFDFLDTASMLLAKGEAGPKADQFRLVFKAISNLQLVHSKAQLDLNNIESIFTALEIAKVLKKLPGSDSDEISSVISALQEMIVVTLESTIKFPTRGPHIQPTPTYESFSDLLFYLATGASPQIDSSVITFNYDIALDVALNNNMQGPLYGFEPSVPAGRDVSVYKLHGSLNWAVTEDTAEVIPLHIHDYFSKYSIQGFGEEISNCTIPIGSQLKDYFLDHKSIKVQEEPVIVPPTWNKADYHQLLSSIWAQAAKELEEAEHIFIIGYSLPETDAFFRLLFGIGTAGEKLLKQIVVYNPDTSGQVDTRFRTMLGPGALERYSYREKPFDLAIADIKAKFPARDR